MLDRLFKTCSEPRESIPVPFLDSNDWKYIVIYILAVSSPLEEIQSFRTVQV